jgi:glycosyltransferase involved in cell wall biosynthesis
LKKINILFLAYTFDNIGGINSYANGLLIELSKFESFFNIYVVKKTNPNNKSFFNNIQVVNYPYRKVTLLNKLYWENTKLPKILLKENIDIIHGIDYSIPLIKTKAIKISTFHDAILFTNYDGRKYFKKFILKYIFKYYYKYANYIFTVSEFSMQDILNKYKSNKVVLNTGIGVNDVFFIKKHNKLDFEYKNTKAKYFIYYGGFRENKNVSFLDSIIDILYLNNIKLYLVGEGSSTVKFSNNYSSLVVVSLGYKSTEELIILLQNSIALLYPSNYEGFGLPVMESMILGVPVISANNTSLKEISSNYNLLYKSNNVNDIRKKVLLLIENNSYLDQNRTTLDDYIEKYKWSNVIINYIKIYNNIYKNFNK